MNHKQEVSNKEQQKKAMYVMYTLSKKRKGLRETDGFFFYSHHRHPKTIHLHTRDDDENIIFHADKSKKWLRILIKFSNAEVLQRGNRASFTHPVAIETITTNIEHESQKREQESTSDQAPIVSPLDKLPKSTAKRLVFSFTIAHQRIPTNLERTELVHQINCLLQLSKCTDQTCTQQQLLKC